MDNLAELYTPQQSVMQIDEQLENLRAGPNNGVHTTAKIQARKAAAAEKPARSALENLNGARWYHIDPSKLFTASFSPSDYNSGACNGHWKDAKFMQEPYIKKDSNSISAFVTDDVRQKNACIYQHTENTCTFSLGANGVQ